MYEGRLAVRRADADAVAAWPINLSAALVGSTATLLWRMVGARPTLPLLTEVRSKLDGARSSVRPSWELDFRDGSSSFGLDMRDKRDGLDWRRA